MNTLARMLRRQGGDEGVSLLLVLIFIFGVGVIITALLPYAQTGISEARVARDVRGLQNAADGAIKGAIEQLRHDAALGTTAGNCPTYVAKPYPDPVSATKFINITVTCAPASGVTSPPVDIPPYSIITTGGGITTSGNATLSVDGGIYATGDVARTGGSQTNYLVIGPVYSKNGTCPSSFVTSTVGILHCPASPPTTDPDFPTVDFPSTLGETVTDAQTAVSALDADPLGVCDVGTNYVRFQPGYYSQIPTPDETSCGSNPPKTYWFAPCKNPPCSGTDPGTYYLDFADKSYAQSPAYDAYTVNSDLGLNYSNQAFWDLNQANITVIGGTLKSDWQSQLPGHRCDLHQAGVQVILGGPSQLSTGNGSELELCASRTSSTSSQRIAFYGLSDSADFGIAAPTGPRPGATDDVPATGAADTAGDQAFTNPAGAEEIGGTAATAVVAGDSTYGVDLSGYTLTPGDPIVPDGSLITKAIVRVKHSETVANGTLKPVLKVHYADGTTDSCDVPVISGGLAVSAIDLMKDCNDNYMASADYRWKLLHDAPTDTPVTVTLKEVAKTNNGNSLPVAGDATVDGVHLKISYVAPGLEAERCQWNEATCYSYSNSNSDASDNTFFIGTAFTPDEPMNVVVHNNPETIFQRGVIVDSLKVKVSASSTQTASPFQIPHSTVIDRTVVFTATLTGDTKKVLQARVHYIDCSPAPGCVSAPNDEGTQFAPGRRVEVLHWTNLH